MPDGPHSRFVAALAGEGWQIVEQRPLFSGPNPTSLIIRRSQRTLRMLVYAWNITSEGKGRFVQAPDGTQVPRSNFRIQTTRSREDKGDLMSPPGYLGVGLGWDEGRVVFGAFDPWIKRTTGWSSSVHMTKQLLDAAAATGWQEQLREDGPECAFKPEEVQRYLDWLVRLQRPRYVHLLAEDFDRDDETCRVTVHPRVGDPAFGLRDGDHFVVIEASGLPDLGVWQVERVDTNRIKSEGGNQKVELLFTGRRIGVVTAKGLASS